MVSIESFTTKGSTKTVPTRLKGRTDYKLLPYKEDSLSIKRLRHSSSLKLTTNVLTNL